MSHAPAVARVCSTCHWFSPPREQGGYRVSGSCCGPSNPHNPPRAEDATCRRWKAPIDPPHVDPEAGA